MDNSKEHAPAACPFGHGSGTYQAFEQTGMYRFLSEARRECPVFFSDEIGYWVVTKRQDVISILRDPNRFSASVATEPVAPYPPEMLEYLKAAGYGMESIQVNCDRPKHTRIRNAAVKFLNLKQFASYEDQIRALARDYIAGFKGETTADLVSRLTYEFPARVLFLLLGEKDFDPVRIKKWADNRLLMIWGRLSPDELMSASENLVDFWRYAEALVHKRLHQPGDDLPSRLLQIRDGNDETISINEIASVSFGIMLAGHETTTNAITNLFLALLSSREQWEKLLADRSLIPNAVEEGLRHASSVVAWRRRALEDVEISGVKIPKGSNILISLGSANHDEDQFDDAEVFDVSRKNAREHISFGNGIHFCLGAPLARLEMRIVLEELLDAFPDMRLADNQDFDWVKTISFRGPTQLLVDLTPKTTPRPSLETLHS